MLLWMGLTMLFSRHSVWWFPNLMATALGGDAALRESFGKYTPAGLSIHVLQFSLLGALFAMTAPERTPFTRLLVLGLIVSLSYYYLMYGFVWKHVDPLVTLYSPDRQILVGHIFYGFMLARLGNYRSANVPATE